MEPYSNSAASDTYPQRRLLRILIDSLAFLSEVFVVERFTFDIAQNTSFNMPMR